jgi:uncharacterized protein YlxW (UPF0749 family)
VRRTSPALVAVVAILGFLLVTTAHSAKADRRAAEPRKARLIDLIQTRRSQVDDLDAAVAKLRDSVSSAQQKAARARRQGAAQAQNETDLAVAAGTIAVRGSGIEVRLTDSDRPAASPDDADAGRIHDVDLQLVINALYQAGAEAISVNGQRVVATTAVRAAGDTIVINFRPLRPPYKVTAIGAHLDQFNASDIARHFRRWSTLFGLSFSTHGSRSLTVPAYAGRVGITAATPQGGG